MAQTPINYIVYHVQYDYIQLPVACYSFLWASARRIRNATISAPILFARAKSACSNVNCVCYGPRAQRGAAGPIVRSVRVQKYTEPRPKHQEWHSLCWLRVFGMQSFANDGLANGFPWFIGRQERCDGDAKHTIKRHLGKASTPPSAFGKHLHLSGNHRRAHHYIITRGANKAKPNHQPATH